jgi:hypothetical protein
VRHPSTALNADSPKCARYSLWDPLPDPATIPIHPEDVRALAHSLKTLADMSERIARAYESKLEPPP